MKTIISPIKYKNFNKEESISYLVYGVQVQRISTNKNLKPCRIYLNECNKSIINWTSENRTPQNSKLDISKLKRIDFGGVTSGFLKLTCQFDKAKSVSITFGKNIILEVIFTTELDMNMWLSGVHYIFIDCFTSKDPNNLDNKYCSELWEKADENRDGKLSLDEIKSMMRTMNIYANHSVIEKILLDYDNSKDNLISKSEFSVYFEKTMQRPEITEIFSTYSENSEFMSKDQFQNFCLSRQKTKENIFDKISEEFQEGKKLDLKLFRNYLLSPTYNSAYRKEFYSSYMDMTQPLAHYFISSSHNTYLEGHQITGKSSSFQYSNVLSEGCKCLEIDIWEGPDGPVVTHGYTLVNKVLLREVALEIKKNAFINSPYPVILSLENHCGFEQTGQIGDIFKEVFGDSIFFPQDFFPSPEELKFKFIVKAKVTPADEVKRKGTHPLLAEITALAGAKFAGLSQDCRSIVSFKEKGLKKVAKAHGSANVIQYHTRVLSRIYPEGKRISSSNYNPLDYWIYGAQLAAINYQSCDTGKLINSAWFLPNANCGYVLKPSFMRNQNIEFDIEGSNFRTSAACFCIEIISAFNLPKAKDNDSIISPYIEIEMHGIPKDKHSEITSTVEKNGFNPIWREKFRFDIRIFEFCVLSLKVFSKFQIGSICVAQFAVPLYCLNTGIRCFQLMNSEHELLPNSFLLCETGLILKE